MTAPAHPDFPLARLIGMTTAATGAGTAVSRVTVGPDHLNPHGAVHGAVMFAMVDTAMGAATMSVLGEGQLCASIDVQLRFCAPVFDGALAATVEVVKAGKKVVLLQGRVVDQADTVVAFGTGAFSVFPLSR